MTALIAVHTHYYPPLDISPGAPALVVQITELVHSYMIWAGSCEEIPGAEASTEPSEAITQPTSSLADASENAKVAISRQDVALVDGVDPRVLSAIQRGRIAKDWACAMPSGNPAIPTPSTSLFRSNESDVALSMSQQLARRWKKQIFLSLDLPPKFEQGTRTIVEMEKRVMQSIRRVETKAGVSA